MLSSSALAYLQRLQLLLTFPKAFQTFSVYLCPRPSFFFFVFIFVSEFAV